MKIIFLLSLCYISSNANTSIWDFGDYLDAYDDEQSSESSQSIQDLFDAYDEEEERRRSQNFDWFSLYQKKVTKVILS